MATGNNQLIELYRTMLTIRRFEERASRDSRNGTIPGLVHSYIGQEAVAAGVCASLRKDDRIVSNHRGHGHCIAKGADIRRMMAEIHGKITGYCKGKGGSMHIADFSIGILGANGIVGAGLPIATGAALAAKLEGKGGVAAVFFGDGATQEGEFHESLNLASVWKLPVIYICENNRYGVNTPADYAIAGEDVFKKAAGYGLYAEAVDGNDVETVYEKARDIIARMREGGGPAFLECQTYRWHSHFESDRMPDLRPKAEIESWKQRCPLARFERKLLDAGILTGEETEAMNSQVLAQIEAAVKFAVDSPLPAPENALDDVFSA